MKTATEIIGGYCCLGVCNACRLIILTPLKGYRTCLNIWKFLMRHRVSCYHSRTQIPRAGPHSSPNTKRVMPIHKYSSTFINILLEKNSFFNRKLTINIAATTKKNHHEKYSLSQRENNSL